MKAIKEIRIAIADDHKQMRTAISDYLRKMGFAVIIEAKSGKDLLCQLENAAILPDVCLLDYRMPAMMGDELAAVVSKQFPAIKLAAMTANMDNDSMVKMLTSGCDSYLLKNSSPEEWSLAIQGLVTHGYYCTDWMARTLLEHIRFSYRKSSKT